MTGAWGQDGGAHRRLVSLRDLLAWAGFINSAVQSGLRAGEAFLHGACMVLLDGLGTGDGTSDLRARSLRSDCFSFLTSLLPQVLPASLTLALSLCLFVVR